MKCAATVWGGFFNDTKKHDYKEGTYFFDSKSERKKWIKEIENRAEELGQCVVVDEKEGKYVRFRTIASMILILDGTEYSIEYDFGYDYDSAEYMFLEGNYSCDCNRYSFLSELYDEIEFDEDTETAVCGNLIKIKDFKVYREKGTQESFDSLPVGPRLPRKEGE